MGRAPLIGVFVVVVGCSSSPKLPVETLEDPSTCMTCHPQHYTQWSGSMHAYSSDDPVFLAMNARGQRETNNQLGTFCVQCHAPMAVALKLTDGTNFDPTTLPPTARGITCFFCHNVESVDADHNNGLVLALDDTMRGGVQDPDAVENTAHNNMYDTMMDSYTNKSVECGSCHDVTTPSPPAPVAFALERTYSEWQTTVFANYDPSKPLVVETCSACHMQSDPNTTVIAVAPNVKSRQNSFHLHAWPAVDQALTPFPDTAEQMTDLQAILDPALTIIGPLPPGTSSGAAPGGICLEPLAGGELSVRMDTIEDGHDFPSGASQDRRSWLEVIAYDASNTVLFSSGVVPDAMDPEDIDDPFVNCSGAGSNACSGFWDRIFKADGTPATFFWEVATEQSHLLKPPITNNQNAPGFDHSTTVIYPLTAAQYSNVDHITARIRLRPFSYATLQSLVTSGDLAASVVPAMMPTLDSAGAMRTWTKAASDPDSGCCPIGMMNC